MYMKLQISMNVISSFYNTGTASVKVTGGKSKWFDRNKGVFHSLIMLT